MGLKRWPFHLLLIALFAVLSLANCGVDYKVPEDTIRIHLDANPPDLNPITSNDSSSSSVLGHLFEPLLKVNKDTLAFEPNIAERWTVSDDKKVYTFYLRKDVTWHDGHPFTVDDIIYTYERIQDPEVNATMLRGYYKDIDRVEKIDDYTVRFYYKRIYYRGLIMTGLMTIVPKHILVQYKNFNDNSFTKFPIGNGPFKMKEWVSNQKVVLERYDGYFGKKPKIKTIQMQVINDNSVAFQLLKKGDLDTFDLTAVQFSRQTQDEKFRSRFEKFSYPSLGNHYDYIGWNNKSPLFEDPKVRLALTHLVDRESLVKKLNFGLGQVITGPFFPLSPRYNSKIKPWPYDPQKAISLLKEAGWEDHDGDGILDKDDLKFEFTLTLNSNNPLRIRVATILQEEFSKAGIKAKVVRMEWGAFIQKVMNRDFDATVLGWGYAIEGDPYQIWHKSGADAKGSSNYISFVNDEVSDLVEAAREEFDPEKRKVMYDRFQEILHELQPYSFLYYVPSTVAVSKRFKNLKVYKAGMDMYDWEPVGSQ